MLPCNWDAAQLFRASQTQWRYGPSGRIVGLDYRGCESAAAGLSIDWPEIFPSIRTMESVALEALAEGQE